MTEPFDIVIAGELNLDLILYGLPTHMPVEVELLASGFCATLGSFSAIVVHNAASLGARVALTSLIWSDDLGRYASVAWRRRAFDTSHVRQHSSLSTASPSCFRTPPRSATS